MVKTAEHFFDLKEEPPIPKKPTNLSIREFTKAVTVDGEFYCRADLKSPDEGYIGVPGRNIALWVRPPGEVERVVRRHYTGPDGTVEFRHIFESAWYDPGRYRFWLEFTGDDEYEGCKEEIKGAVIEGSILAGLSWG